jgi:hypothetical protein
MEPPSCGACGLSVSAKDDKCPHCHHPIDSAKHTDIDWPTYVILEIVMCVLLILALSHFEHRSPQTKPIIPNFPAHDGMASLPANNSLNNPTWPLAPFPNAADIEAKSFFELHPQK